jgi:nucleoside permease NupC
MSSVSSLMIGSYATKMAIPLRSLLAQSAMVIPGAIINAKVVFPEADPSKPLTRSRESTCAGRKKLNLRKAHDLLDSLSDGALVGLRVAGLVLYVL